MKKQTIVIANILLLIVVTSMYMSATGQTQETRSKINSTIIFIINRSDIRDALTSVQNNTTPHYLKLSENQINEALKHLPGWTILDGKLHKTFTFVDFSTLFEFMYQVADSSQKLNHGL